MVVYNHIILDMQENKKRILLVGDINGPCRVLESWEDILKKKDFVVEKFQLNQSSKRQKWGYRLENLFGSYVGSLGTKLIQNNFKKINERLIEKAKNFKPELLLVIQGSQMLPRTIEKIHSFTNTKSILWLLDDPATLSDAMSFASFSEYSAIFCVDNSWISVISLFNKNTYFLASATDPTIYYPTQNTLQKDILFVGALPKRSPNGVIKSYFLKKIAEAGFSINIYGPGVSKSHYLKHIKNKTNVVLRDEFINHKELNELYGKFKIIININNPMFKENISDRVMNAASAGAFQIVDFKKGIREIFPEEILPSFYTEKDLLEIIKKALENNQWREMIAHNARDYTLKFHTHEHRLNTILERFLE